MLRNSHMFAMQYLAPPLPILTPSPLLQAPLSFLLPQPRLLLLLLLPTLMKVFHHHANKHVEHEEADDEEKGDEKQQHPGVVVPFWLQGGKKAGVGRSTEWQKRVREEKIRWGESTNKTMQILSQQEHCQLTSMHLPAFSPHTQSFSTEKSPLLLEASVFTAARDSLNSTKNTDTTLPNVNWTNSPYSFYTSEKLFLFVCAFVCSPAGPPQQHPGRHTWCWPIRPYTTAQTVTSAPTRLRHRHTVKSSVRAGVRATCMSVCGPNLPQVVKVVLPPIPAMPCSQTLCFIGDVAHIKPIAVVKFSFKQLHTHKESAQRPNDITWVRYHQVGVIFYSGNVF